MFIALLLGLGLVFAPSSATSAECQGSGDVVGGQYGIVVECTEPGESSAPTPINTGGQPDPFVKYQWASICTLNPDIAPSDLECTAAMTCAQPQQRLWQLWGQLPNGSWQVLRTQCFGGTPPEFTPPQVTQEMVLTALRRVGLPQLTTQVQPNAKTLVNFDTIFYTEPEPVALDLTILGQGVEVEAQPTAYRWVFGDGTEMTTDSPGAPYPSKEILHRYTDADVNVQPHVEAVYSARFRVNGGDWQEISETVTTVGPSTDLRVVEGTPLLTAGSR